MKNNIFVFCLLLLLAVVSRLVPHMWNFTLLGGVFLFAGSYFQDKKVSLALMLSAMLISDAVIGFHTQMLSVYLAYAVVVALGFMLKPSDSRLKILGFAFSGSFIFYAITNFAVWFGGQLYPMTIQGLVDCYIAGLPFYRNQLLSDLVSSYALFEVARYAKVYARQEA